MKLETTLAKVVEAISTICDTGHFHTENKSMADFFSAEGFVVVPETIGGTADVQVKVYCIMEEYSNG